MIATLLTGLALLACAIILWRAEPALARMTPSTPFTVRVAMWLLVVGSAAQLLALAMGISPQAPTVVLELGIACLLYCERRLRVLIPRPTPRGPCSPQHRPRLF